MESGMGIVKKIFGEYNMELKTKVSLDTTKNYEIK